MIEAKYGLKYSFPHSLVHIVDNSGRTVEVDTSVADDPSLYSTIVVSGFPMGEDNRVVSLMRSDIVNVAYGAKNLTASDIDMYGQSIEYPASLIEQGAPVQLLRVTPPGSTYAFSTILVEWRTVGTTFEVRFKTADAGTGESGDYSYIGKIGELSMYKNQDRLNTALVNGFKKDPTPEYSVLGSEPSDWATNYKNYYVLSGTKYVHVDGETAPTFVANTYYKKNADYNEWTRRVFINNISGGRGRNYNYMSTYINKTQQPKRPNQMRYEFGTIDGRTSETVEQFIAALINDSTATKLYTTETIDTVNQTVKKRAQGSSVVIPYVNENAVRELFDAYVKHFASIKDAGTDATYIANAELYNAIFKRLNVNTFDPIYGTFIYSAADDVELNLPYYTVDMYNTEIPRLDSAHLIKIDDTDINADYITGDKMNNKGVEHLTVDNVIKNQLCGVADVKGYTGPYVGDVYLVNNANDPYFSIVTSINQYSGVVKSSAPIRKVYIPKISGSNPDRTADTTTAPVSIKRVFPNVNGLNQSTIAEVIKTINKQIVAGDILVGDVIVATGAAIADTDPEFKIFYVTEIEESSSAINAGKIKSVITYESSYIYSFLDLNDVSNIDNEIIRMTQVTGSNDTADSTSPAWNRYGSLCIQDSVESISEAWVLLYFDNPTTVRPGGKRGWIKIDAGNKRSKAKVGAVPTSVTITSDLTNVSYDVCRCTNDHSNFDKSDWYAWPNVVQEIRRAVVSNAVGSTYRVIVNPVTIPANYYVSDYGDSLYSESGGVALAFGSTGFFDQYEDGEINSVEFKWRYSELLVQAFKGEIDPRIMSPNRVPAKFMFDGGWNTVVGLTRLPFNYPDIEDVVYASTVFTEDEKETLQNNITIISGIKSYTDVDVKQAMYDLMVYRCYQGIPEDKRPIGPGSGLSLHLDAGVTDAATALLVNKSFSQRFDNPNASWDIGGYTSAANGVTYTYMKKLVDNLTRHSKLYTVNKPYVGKYTSIYRDEYISYFPDVDATDWDLRELLYNSGGNAWIADTNGTITRRSQRTLKQDNMTSDLIQENNMRTLSQLVYLLQNKIDTYLLEYDDDGVLQGMSEDCNNMFSGWVGTCVNALSIRFERDVNIDGGDIVVCYVDVTFRGLILRVPIIVNVQRRAGYGES